MFNVGPMEMLVIAIVGIVVIGPEKLPGFARQAAQMLKTLRELASGAQKQLQDELGPEFADVDLRNLNPRTAMRKAVFGDDFDGFSGRDSVRRAVFGDEDLSDADPRKAFRETRDSYRDSYRDTHDEARDDVGDDAYSEPFDDEPVDTVKHVNGSSRVSFDKPEHAEDSARPRPRPKPTYSDDDVL